MLRNPPSISSEELADIYSALAEIESGETVVAFAIEVDEGAWPLSCGCGDELHWLRAFPIAFSKCRHSIGRWATAEYGDC